MFAPSVVAIPEAAFHVVEVNDAAHGVQGFVVIHSSLTHRGRGGVRIYSDVTRQEVELLARGMTYKYCFHNIRMNGAKGGIRLPDVLTVEERRNRLQLFGSHIRHLISTDTFMPSTDMNCRPEDVVQIYRGAGVTRNKTPRGSSDPFGSGEYTALSTMAGIVAASRHLGIDPPDCRVTIEGLGTVGRQLAVEVDRWGGLVIGVSSRFGAVSNPNGLDVSRLLDVSAHGDNWPTEANGDWERLSTSGLFTLPMDIHVPCARVHSVNSEIADLLQCAAVVPSANAPCSPHGKRRLRERSILLLPFFVTNSGGVISFRLRLDGMNHYAMRNFFEHDFTDMIFRMLRAADQLGRTPEEVAMDVATANYNTITQQPPNEDSDRRQRNGKARQRWPFRPMQHRRPVERRTDNIPATTTMLFR